jgi:C1A family cysteine protease
MAKRRTPASRRPALVARTVRSYGWVPDLPDHRDLIYRAPRGVLAKLPAKVDLSAGCPAVYDQGDLGSCTAHGIAAALEYAQLKQAIGDRFTPSRLFIYYLERVLERSVPEDAGAMIRDGVKAVAKQGAPHESLWPYIISKFALKPPATAYTDAAKHPALLYRRVTQTLPQLQGCLAAGFPFVFGFSVYESFESATVARTGTVPMPRATEALLGGHAVLAVGYDTATSRFLVRNSWGPGWGKAGYFTMPFAYLTDLNLSDDFWTITLVQ